MFLRDSLNSCYTTPKDPSRTLSFIPMLWYMDKASSPTVTAFSELFATKHKTCAKSSLSPKLLAKHCRLGGEVRTTTTVPTNQQSTWFHRYLGKEIPTGKSHNFRVHVGFRMSSGAFSIASDHRPKRPKRKCNLPNIDFQGLLLLLVLNKKSSPLIEKVNSRYSGWPLVGMREWNHTWFWWGFIPSSPTKGQPVFRTRSRKKWAKIIPRNFALAVLPDVPKD